MERENIMFGDIIVEHNNKEKKISNAVFKENDTIYKGQKIIKIISSKFVGKTSINRNFTEVKKSNEIRNNITGAYE